METGASRLVDTLIGVSAEIVSLALQQIGGEGLRAVAVVVGQSRHEGRSRQARLGRQADNPAPMRLSLPDLPVKVGIQHQVDQVGIARVGLGNLLQEPRPNDAPAPPDPGDGGEVQLPSVLRLGLAHELKTLGVGADLGAVEGVADGGNQLLSPALVAEGGAGQLPGSLDALAFQSAEVAGEDGFGD